MLSAISLLHASLAFAAVTEPDAASHDGPRDQLHLCFSCVTEWQRRDPSHELLLFPHEYSGAMSYTSWLRTQIDRLEQEIRQTSVFDTNRPASVTELRELRQKSVLRTYLKQQLLRRAPVRSAQLLEEDYDTQELTVVRGA